MLFIPGGQGQYAWLIKSLPSRIHVSEIVVMRVGKIRYLNCLPFYAGWPADATVDFYEGHPAEVSRKMRHGDLDAAPISAVEYLSQPDAYHLLPWGIACRQLVRSVTLFSKKKIEDLSGVKIAVTEESLTSSHLLELILKERFGIETEKVALPSNPKAMLAEYDAALLIGDAALFAQPRKWIYRYDLGALWHDWQRLPFVFAVWVVKKSSGLTDNQVRDFEHALGERFRYNREHLAECILRAGGIGEFDRRYPKVFGYLNNLQYALDDDCMRGLEKFSEMAAARGWCARIDLSKTFVSS